MKSKSLAVSAASGVIALLLGSSPVSAQPAASSDKLDFVALDLAGAPFEAQSLAGEPVLVDFWAVWCAPCIASFPLLNQLHDARGSDGVRVLGVAVHSGGPEKVAAFLKDYAPRYPMLVGDEDLAERFGVVGFPTYLLFGPDGRLVETYVGKLEGFVDELRSRTAQLKASQPATKGGGR